MRADNIIQHLVQDKIKNASDIFYIELYCHLFLDLFEYAKRTEDYITFQSLTANFQVIEDKIESISETSDQNKIIKKQLKMKLKNMKDFLSELPSD